MKQQKVSEEGWKMWRCYDCKSIVYEPSVSDPKICPLCGGSQDQFLPMCKRDIVPCGHDLSAGVAYCPDCGEPMCPVCGCHDVAQISRVTGYLQEVSGWNAGKRQELKDRQRYDVATGPKGAQ